MNLKCFTYIQRFRRTLPVEGINFKAMKGQTIGVIGGTGSGKSSLVNLIPRLYDATQGEVLVDGVNVKDYDIEALRNKVGIVMQKAVLLKVL